MIRRLALFLILAAPHAQAAEGFWTFPALPSQRIAQDARAVPPDAALDRLRRATLRLGNGCSAALVGPKGLILTNHHCVIDCVKSLGAAGGDAVETGLTARNAEDEKVCAELTAEQPMADEDVTGRFKAALQGLAGEDYAKALDKATGDAVGECQGADETKICGIVSLFDGAQFRLQTFRVYRDVRMVFAPENRAAQFGGDPDNFAFPRYGFDMALLRLYGGGKPAHAKDWLGWREAPPAVGEAVFAAGYPSVTYRHFTLDQLQSMRDFALPFVMVRLSEMRGRLLQFSAVSPENRRIAADYLYEVENSLKASRGEHDSLSDPETMSRKADEEALLKSKILGDPKLQASAGSAFAEIHAAEIRYRQTYRLNELLGVGLSSGLWGEATGLVRAATQRAKPEAERSPRYIDENLATLEQELLSANVFEPKLDELRLAFGLEKLREYLGADDPLVRRVLGRESPEALAARVIGGSRLGDLAYRRELFEGGLAAVSAAGDPLLALARIVDPEAEKMENVYQREVEAPQSLGHQRLLAARHSGSLAGRYPDADGSLRISFGRVEGWTGGDGRSFPACTIVEGLFSRATGAPPFALAVSWNAAAVRLDPRLPFNCVATLDAVGGNSGSPVVDAEGLLVGLLFDGNLPSLGGTYVYDGAKNRAIFLTAASIRAGLSVVYGIGPPGE